MLYWFSTDKLGTDIGIPPENRVVGFVVENDAADGLVLKGKLPNGSVVDIGGPYLTEQERSMLFPSWNTLTYAAAMTINATDGALQKVVLGGNVTLTAPALSADTPTLLLQVDTQGNSVTVGSSEVIPTGKGIYQIGWFWDGAVTRSYTAVPIS